MAEDLYDPTDHTVQEVQDYLATADGDEFARVKGLEAAGKDRAGIRDYTQDPANAEALEPDEDGYTRVVVSTG